VAQARRSADASEGGSEGSLRLCVVTRQERPPEELIRFVVGPDGALVPDLARRLPGRGAWVTAAKTAVAAAVKSKAFARSLKRPVRVPEDFPERVEHLLEKRVTEALALANKAGLVVTGFEKVDALIGRGEAAALVCARNAALGGRERLQRKFIAVQTARGAPVRVIDALDVEQMSLAMGRSNVVHAALTQGGAAEHFSSEAERLTRYRSGFGASGPAQVPPLSSRV
jgi:predicted RNA-binding protein YlxR (DUF448 family)